MVSEMQTLLVSIISLLELNEVIESHPLNLFNGFFDIIYII